MTSDLGLKSRVNSSANLQIFHGFQKYLEKTICTIFSVNWLKFGLKLTKCHITMLNFILIFYDNSLK